MDRDAVLVVHLVELVDQAHAPVRQHQGPALQGPLPGDGVPLHRGRQAHRRRALARGEHRALRRALDVLQELRLGRARVPKEEHVDVPAQPVRAAPGLLLPAEERQREPALDVGVAVDRGRDRRRDALADARVARQRVHLGAVLVGQRQRVPGAAVARGAPRDVVGLEQRCEDREAVARVERDVVGVRVDARHVDELARLGRVDQVVAQDHILLAREAAGRDGPGGLLHGDLLVVLVERLGRVDGEGALGLALRARAQLDRGAVVGLRKRPQQVPALDAVVLDQLQHREHARAARGHTAHAHQLVEVVLPQVADRVVDRQVGQAHEDLAADRGELGELLERDVERGGVQDRQQRARGVGRPDGDRGEHRAQVAIGDDERLRVGRAHLAHARAVDALARDGVGEPAQEGLELRGDGAAHGLLGEVLARGAAGVVEVDAELGEVLLLLLPLLVGLLLPKGAVVGRAAGGEGRGRGIVVAVVEVVEAAAAAGGVCLGALDAAAAGGPAEVLVVVVLVEVLCFFLWGGGWWSRERRRGEVDRRWAAPGRSSRIHVIRSLSLLFLSLSLRSLSFSLF